ncbi:glycosyltransferase [Bradyrhizobium sp.]|uniref:glycosyltransferase n=1 Tax=Bradyrhizobium sp. TaxID=376 RepID=UPI003C77A10B
MTDRKPFLSVIIPHLNQPEGLDACLTSLDAQNFERARFEVIVVDNGSACLPQGVIASHSACLLEEPKAGPGLARNRGVEAATGEILCFIDADCRAHPNWLRVASEIISMPERVVLGGDVQIWRDDQSRFTSLEAYESLFAYMQKRYIEKNGFSGTGNLVVRRIDIMRVGPFKGIEVAEDMDWGSRAIAAGLRFRYEPDLIIYHPARRTMAELFAKWDRHLQHYLNKAKEKPLWRIFWAARAVGVFLSPVAELGKILTSPKISGLSTRFQAASVLVAIRSYRAWKMLQLLGPHKTIIWNSSAVVDRNAGNRPA